LILQFLVDAAVSRLEIFQVWPGRSLSLRLKFLSRNLLYQFLQVRVAAPRIISAAYLSWNAKRMQCIMCSLSEAALYTFVLGGYVARSTSSYRRCMLRSYERIAMDTSIVVFKIGRRESKKLICTRSSFFRLKMALALYENETDSSSRGSSRPSSLVESHFQGRRNHA